MKTKTELFINNYNNILIICLLRFEIDLLFYPSDASFNHQKSKNTYQNNGYAFWYLHVV